MSYNNTQEADYEMIAGNSSAVTELLSGMDDLLYTRLEILAANCRQAESAVYIVESIPIYGRYVEIKKIISTFLRSGNWSRQDLARSLSCLTNTLDILCEQIDLFIDNESYRDRVLETLPNNELAVEKRRQYNSLAERRAYLRTVISKIEISLSKQELTFPEKSTLLEKLKTFKVLDNYPNVPTNDKEAEEIKKSLDILEPVLDKVQTVIKQREKHKESDKLFVDVVAKSSTPSGESSAARGKNTTKPKPKFDIDQKAKPAANSAQPYSRLGSYIIQRGDTLADILLGETAAGQFPIFYELTATQKKQVIRLARKYFSNYPNLGKYIGSRESIDKIARSSGQVEISLDALHDVISYIAHEHGFIKIAQESVSSIRELLQNTETESRFHQETSGGSVIQNTVNELYAGEQEIFLEEWWLWMQEKLQTEADSPQVRAILNCPYKHWKILYTDSTKRYQWLREIDLPLRVWNDWSELIRKFIPRLAKYRKYNLDELTVEDILKLTFLHEIAN